MGPHFGGAPLLRPSLNTQDIKGDTSRDMGTYLQLHLHPIHRQHLVLKENGKDGEG